MKIHNPFADLTKFEWGLWLFSFTAVLLSFFLTEDGSLLNTLASLIGVTALILLAKGAWQGQVLVIVFAVFYGIISFYFRYYGEMITYLCLTLPLAAMSLVSWLRHPYRNTGEVAVSRLTKKHLAVMLLLTVAITSAFYFLLQALDTANLTVSTLSIATSLVAAFLTFCRSPYFALGYAFNDVVLIVLWVLATIEDLSYLPMVVCFSMFLLNDAYGFISWKRMQRRQEADGT